MFWIISAILTVVALAFVLPSLLRQRNTLQDASREQNIAIANEQLEDLEARFEQGKIDNESYQATRDELEQSLFSDIKATDVNESIGNSDSARPSFIGTILIALLIPAIAIPLYLKVGNLPFTEMLDSKKAAEKVTNAAVPLNADGTPDIDTMIAGLQKKMETEPKNATGWTMLGRSYMVLKRYPEAVNSYERAFKLKPQSTELMTALTDSLVMLGRSYMGAKRYPDATNSYERALKLKPQSADLMMALADSLAMTNNGEITGRPVELINKALEIEPENQIALWLGGMAARQQGNHLIAIERWRKVLSLVKNPNERKQISSLIAEAMMQLTPEQKKKMEASVTSKAIVPAMPVKNDSVPSAGIIVSISMSEKFKAQVNPTDLVFIYAKAMSGPPMPLAAVRKQIKDLPLEVVLNDEMAMMPNLKLSGFSEVIVGARVSKSGQPVAQNGDLFSEKVSVKAGDKVSLEIDTVVVK